MKTQLFLGMAALKALAGRGVIMAVLLAAGAGWCDSPYARWPHGPSNDPSFFPIAVWLQPPSKARLYREAGFNTYVALWNGPTESQLAALKEAGMKVICEQNATGLRHTNDPVIIGWMHGDEPDNAQSLGAGKGYGPPILPAKIIADYERIRAADPTRPVMLNLGQGVAWDDYYGRGVRTRHPEDYPEYMRGGDIVSFDIYPAVHTSPKVAGNLWYVARGVERLVEWGRGAKVIWNCIECTRIDNEKAKPSPSQVEAEVWMSLIHGSRGLIYFVHEWKPRFNESALLSDPVLLEAIGRLNRRITALAPVLNQPSDTAGLVTRPADPEAPVAAMLKRGPAEGVCNVFAVAMRGRPGKARFAVSGRQGSEPVEVDGENRSLTAVNGEFEDAFGGYETRLYRLGRRP